MSEPIPFDIVAAPEDEPLVLSGPPGDLTGRVALHNPGDVNLVLRDAGLKDPSGVLTILPLRHTLPALVLRPDQGRVVPLRAAVDPATPPGEYHATLELAGRSRPAVLHVVEVFDLTIRPQSLVVVNRPGRAQRKRVVVTNRGNVTFSIGDLGDVELKDDMIWERAVRVAVEPWAGREDFKIEELVVAVLRVARDEAFRVGCLSVRSLAGQVDVAPGETAAIDLEITLREALPSNGRYRGRAALLTQDLELVVVSSSEPAVPAEKAEKAAAAPKKTPKRQGGPT
jgi:hypothetical protein